MNLKEAYSYAVLFLERNNIDEADFKALCIVCSIAGIKNSQYSFHKEDFVPYKKLADMLWKIKSGEPLQYVLGKWDFYDSEFFVGEGVLIPRPETEELVQRVISAVGEKEYVIYDLCAGSGCIGVSIAKACPNSKVYLFEKSEKAFSYLEKNCEGVKNAVPLLWDINDIPTAENADIIVSNPPYIESGELSGLQPEVQREPVMALDGGEDGLDFYRIINAVYPEKLNHGGRLFLEIGEKQGESIRAVLNNFSNITLFKDIYGNDRIVSCSLKE